MPTSGSGRSARRRRSHRTWGISRYNDLWPDVSLEAIARRNEQQKELLEKLKSLDPAGTPLRAFPTGADRLNYTLFRQQAEMDLEEYPFRWWLVPLNQREGIQDENSLADSLQFTAVKDYEDWIVRLQGFPAYMEQTIALMRQGIKEKIVQSKIVMRRVPQQIKQQIVENPADSLFYKPLKTFPAEIAAAEQERLQTAAKNAIADCVVPAYREFAEFFDKEYLPACFDQVGAWQLPRGARVLCPPLPGVHDDQPDAG